MIARTLVAVSILLACLPAFAESPEVEAKIDAVFARYNQPDSPGAVVGVVKDGALVFAKGYGMDNIAAGKPLTPDSRMNIGSTSKQFAAACIVLLAQEGKLTLGDDIRKWLPETPDYGSTITIRHLLNHTSGLRDYLQLRSMAGFTDETAMTNQTALDLAVRQKELNFAPGAEFLYSNTGYVLLAIIIERVSGKTMTQFAQERIFAPLGMTMTCVDTNLSLYTDSRTLSYPSRGKNVVPANRLDIVEGDGNVMTTVGDLAKWDQNFYDPKVGGNDLVDQMLTRGVLNDGKAIDYALGLGHDTMLGRATVDHGGAWLGFRAQLVRFPQDRLSVIVLCNMATMNPDALAESVAKIYLGEPAANNETVGTTEKGIDLKKRDLKAKVGTYFVDDTGMRIDVALEDDALKLSMEGSSATLLATDATTFKPSLPTWFESIAFDAGGDDTPSSITVTSPRGNSLSARRVEPSDEVLAPAAIAGTYYSAEIDAEYTIAARDGAAEVTQPNGKPIKLEPIHGDWFRARARYHFEKGASGNVTGFRINAGRVKNILFEKRID